MSGYAVIIEQGETSFGADVPELPGLGVAADSLEEVERLIREAIPLHIESLRAHGILCRRRRRWPPWSSPPRRR